MVPVTRGVLPSQRVILLPFSCLALVAAVRRCDSEVCNDCCLLFCCTAQASKGHEAVARLLLARGGDVTKKDKTGGTPLHRACGAGRLALARLLIEEARAGIEVADRSGATPLLVAVSSGQDAVAVYLASKGANLEAMSKEEETPLGMALAPLRAALLQARAGEADEGDMEVQ